MNLFRLSFNLLRRDWRAGEWRVLLLALVLAVGSLATVGLFADRVRQALQQQATSLIGADLRITSTRLFSPDYRNLAEARGLRVVESRTFPSMVSGNERVLLAEIQGVESGYPLRGKMVIDDGKGSTPSLALMKPLAIRLSPQTDKSLVIPRGNAAVGRVSPKGHESPSERNPTNVVSARGNVGLRNETANPTYDSPHADEGSGSIPTHGTVWADDRLMRHLDVRVGDELVIGAQHFRLAARIVKDIDQSIGFASFAPRVLMNAADMKGTGLLQEGSRVSYLLMIAGDAAQVSALRAVLRLTANERLEDVRDARPEIRKALERAGHFLGLAALTAAILAGAAILLAARRYVARHLDGCAVMRCLGAQQGQILRLFLYQFLILGLISVTAGVLLGYVTQEILVESVATMREANLPAPGVLPAIKAAASGYALLIGFAFLPLLQMRRVSPMRVIRREMGLPEGSAWLIYGLAGGVLALLFLWQAGSLKLGMAVLSGLLAGMLVFGLLAWSLLARSGQIYLASSRSLAAGIQQYRPTWPQFGFAGGGAGAGRDGAAAVDASACRPAGGLAEQAAAGHTEPLHGECAA